MSRFLLLVLFPVNIILAQVRADSILHELPEILFLTRDLSSDDVQKLIQALIGKSTRKSLTTKDEILRMIKLLRDGMNKKIKSMGKEN